MNQAVAWRAQPQGEIPILRPPVPALFQSGGPQFTRSFLPSFNSEPDRAHTGALLAISSVSLRGDTNASLVSTLETPSPVAILAKRILNDVPNEVAKQ